MPSFSFVLYIRLPVLFFSLEGILPLQSDWSLSRDHGLDQTLLNARTTTAAITADNTQLYPSRHEHWPPCYACTFEGVAANITPGISYQVRGMLCIRALSRT